jgi:hypothetical protein
MRRLSGQNSCMRRTRTAKKDNPPIELRLGRSAVEMPRVVRRGMGGTGGTSPAEDDGAVMLPRCPLLPPDDRWLLRRLADRRPALDTMTLDLRTAET